ncbi:kunitz-type U19-barytoxin-Tl1a-like, partial [Notechis scutatus]|uniref:Kunitz-type U19-barytoxin-Tl1a-like n=1 Tax=Notechis scutatus TaxID=8663 RepID=A0A6J1W306_9SAUR
VYPEKCQLPLDAGRCKASFLHFYFNAATGNCEEFIYNGCGGNDNNFYTMAQCRTECQRSVSPEPPEICNLPRKIGRCKVAFLRFYFNKATGKCKRFFYGGCGGNKNNFYSMAQCRATCQRS